MRFADFIKLHAPIKHPEPLWKKVLPPQPKRRKTMSGLNVGDEVHLWAYRDHPPGLGTGVVTRLAGLFVYVRWSGHSRSSCEYASNLLRRGSIEHAQAARRWPNVA